MTRLTLLELVDALEIPDVPDMDRDAYQDAASLDLNEDDLFRALLRSEGLTACQDKLLRWAHDLYGADIVRNKIT